MYIYIYLFIVGLFSIASYMYLRLGPSASQVAMQSSADEIAKLLVAAWAKNPGAGTLVVQHGKTPPPTPLPDQTVETPGGSAAESEGAKKAEEEKKDEPELNDGEKKDEEEKVEKEKKDEKVDEEKADEEKEAEKKNDHGMNDAAEPNGPDSPVPSPTTPAEDLEGTGEGDDGGVSDAPTVPGLPKEPLDKKSIKLYTEGFLAKWGLVGARQFSYFFWGRWLFTRRFIWGHYIL